MENFVLTEGNDMPANIQIGIAKKNMAGITYEEHPKGWFNEDKVHNGWTAKKETRTDFKKPNGSSAGTIIAVIIILLCCCVGVAGFVLYRRRMAASDDDDEEVDDDEVSRRDSLVSSDPVEDGKIN